MFINVEQYNLNYSALKTVVNFSNAQDASRVSAQESVADVLGISSS